MKSFLSALWERWKKFAHAFGVFQTRLILTLLYYTLLLPFGIVIRLFSDPLALKPRGKGSNWIPRTTRDKTLDDLRRQS